MARRRRPEIRVILPDPRFGDLVISKFINNLMLKGKKSIAEKIFYDSLKIISSKLKIDTPEEIFKKALENATPMLEVRSRRIGGSTYQVPIEVNPKRKQALAMRWLIDFSRTGKGKNMALKLANELISASKNEGSTIEKKKNTHKMAEANKAFAHFRI
ncbi:MAG: 30S ribosomal protein S7 [Candidatus Marinimicrobia bacterium]|nr:30S ribosomal protein S7 [Candidatus Neomarinimicrobiota bacterium]